MGSSSTSTLGCAVSTEPIATRCCWPPERLRSARGAQIGDAEQVEGLLDALAHHVGRKAQLLHRVRELLLDGVGDEAGERVLPHVPDGLGHVAGLVLSRVAPVDRARGPTRCPPVKWGTSPLIVPSSVDLPDPVGPMTRQSSPSSIVRSTSRSTARSLPACVNERDVEPDHDPTSTGARRRATSGAPATRSPAGSRAKRVAAAARSTRATRP